MDITRQMVNNILAVLRKDLLALLGGDILGHLVVVLSDSRSSIISTSLQSALAVPAPPGSRSLITQNVSSIIDNKKYTCTVNLLAV